MVSFTAIVNPHWVIWSSLENFFNVIFKEQTLGKVLFLIQNITQKESLFYFCNVKQNMLSLPYSWKEKWSCWAILSQAVKSCLWWEMLLKCFIKKCKKARKWCSTQETKYYVKWRHMKLYCRGLKVNQKREGFIYKNIDFQSDDKFLHFCEYK